MGMFDWYEPKPPIASPTTGRPLTEWQGKDGPCALFVWVQGQCAPVDQLASDDAKILDEQRAAFRLPDHFLIYSFEGEHLWYARCSSIEGTWSTAKLVTFDRMGREIEIPEKHA